MTPAKYPITIRRGTDFSVPLFFKQPDETVFDLTGYSIKSQVRKTKLNTGDLIATFTVAIDIPTGCVTLSLTDAQTLLFTDGVAYYDVLITSPTGFDSLYVEGTATIVPTVTQKA
jgi:hypothetical protein